MMQRYSDEVFPCKSACAGFAEPCRRVLVAAGDTWGEGECLVGSGLVLDTPLGGGTGGFPAQEAAPAAPPTAFQNPTALENNACTPSSSWTSAPGAQVSFSNQADRAQLFPG